MPSVPNSFPLVRVNVNTDTKLGCHARDNIHESIHCVWAGLTSQGWIDGLQPSPVYYLCTLAEQLLK